MKTPVKDHSGWYRDANGAISCADSSTYEKYMKGYRADQEKEKQMEAKGKERKRKRMKGSGWHPTK